MHGDIFKRLRIENKMTLETMSESILSAASLSRYERNLIDLPFNTVVRLLNRINVSVAEYAYLINADNSLSQSFENQVEQAYANENTDVLVNLCLSSLSMYRNTGSMRDLFKAGTAGNYYYDLTDKQLLKTKDIDLITEALFEVTDWSSLEINRFGNVIALLNTNQITIISTRIVNSLENIRSLNSQAYLNAWNCLLNAEIVMLNRPLPTDLNATETLINKTNPLKIPNHYIFTILRKNFIKCLLTFRKTHGNNLTEIISFISFLDSHDASSIALEFQHSFNHIKTML